MLTVIVVGTAVAVFAILVASMHSRNLSRRERQCGSSGDAGYMYMDAGSGGSDCVSDSSGGGCDGGGGGGGGD